MPRKAIIAQCNTVLTIKIIEFRKCFLFDILLISLFLQTRDCKNDYICSLITLDYSKWKKIKH